MWLLLKKYIKDDKPYKEIMKELFKVFVEKDKAEDKFSDSWWESTVDLYNIPEKYKGQDICGFGADLAEGFYQYFLNEERQKLEDTEEHLEFYRFISEAFLREWWRLRNEKVRKT